MAQATYTIGPDQSGTAYRTADNNGKEALLTQHKGSSAPSYKQAGMIWCDDSANPLWVYKVWDGSEWIETWTLNTTTNICKPANAALQDGSNVYAADAGSTDDYAITISPAIAAYAIGMCFKFKANTLNTGSATLNVNGLGAKTLKKDYNQNLVTGDIVANQIVEVIYDGTNFQVQSFSGTKTAKRDTKIAKPIYASATTFTVANFSLYDSTETSRLEKLTSTTVDISTFGLNGIAQSSNLTGTVAVTNGSFTVTGTGTAFTTDFVVGDCIAIGAQTARIAIINSNTSITVNRSVWTTTSGQTYKRGARALYGQYYLYVISDGTTPGLILSTRNAAGGETLVDFPTGYRPGTDPSATYKQIAYDATLDVSANLFNKLVLDGWPFCPRIMYNTYFPGHAGSTSETNILLFGGTAGSFTDLDASAFVPKTSSMMFLNVGYQNGNTSTALYIRPKNVNAYWEIYPLPSAFQSHDLVPMAHDGNRMLQYMVTALGNASIAVHSYVIDGVPM